MTHVLVAVDDTRGSMKTIETFCRMFDGCRPASLALVYVEKIEGKSVMDDLILSDSELATLRESLAGSAHQEALDRRAARVLEFFSRALQEKGLTPDRTLVREGHPAEEILKAAEDEGTELIVVGSRSRRLHNLFMGSVSREVANNAAVPVLIVK